MDAPILFPHYAPSEADESDSDSDIDGEFERRRTTLRARVRSLMRHCCLGWLLANDAPVY